MQADYQPYGKINLLTSTYEEKNHYLWTGKELQTPFFDTQWYDSGARYLTPKGIFVSIDPLAEMYPGFSPYVYCKGDPVNRLDANGEIDRKVVKEGAKVTALGVLSIVAGALEVGSMNP